MTAHGCLPQNTTIDKGHMALIIFHAQFNFEESNALLHFWSWPWDCHKILHMPRQQSCRGMCKDSWQFLCCHLLSSKFIKLDLWMKYIVKQALHSHLEPSLQYYNACTPTKLYYNEVIYWIAQLYAIIRLTSWKLYQYIVLSIQKYYSYRRGKNYGSAEGTCIFKY